MGKLKKENGITLIALVVTIIVLLILAGVSISMLTGENGILKRAREAAEKTEQADRDERAKIDKLAELIDETASGEKTVEQVTDEHPGQLEGDGDEQVINSIEDLVVFADSVTKGRNTYDKQTVKLGLSLDFNSSKSYVDPYRTDYGQYGYNGELKKLLTSENGFIPIGANTNASDYTEKSFKGTFDGNGKIIKNLYINQDIQDDTNDLVIGLFGFNYGIIKKIGIENCNISGKLGSNGGNSVIAGGICGRNCKDLNDSFVSGKLLAVGADKGWTFIGGVCGSSDGCIENCFNLATVSSDGGRSVRVGRDNQFVAIGLGC